MVYLARLPLTLLLFTRHLHVWPHTLVRAVGSNLYSLIRSWTTSMRPCWAAPCSMVNPLWFALWSRDCIFGARNWIVLTWPPQAALWRALLPSYMKKIEHISIGIDMDNGQQHKLACKMGRTGQNISKLLLYNELSCVVSSPFKSHTSLKTTYTLTKDRAAVTPSISGLQADYHPPHQCQPQGHRS